MSNVETALSRIQENYRSAVLAKDVTTFVRLYDPKVRVFDVWGEWSYEGLPSWQRAVEAWFTSLGSERVKVGFEDVNTHASADGAVLSAVVTYVALSASGEPLRSVQNRLTWVLRTSGHVLRIVHEHSSAPIGFEDQKAILQRPQR